MRVNSLKVGNRELQEKTKRETWSSGELWGKDGAPCAAMEQDVGCRIWDEGYGMQDERCRMWDALNW